MDAKLLALTLDLQRKARAMTQCDSLPMTFAALDMLDYLGRQIDEAKKLPPQEARDDR
jgi:hypothetical protein